MWLHIRGVGEWTNRLYNYFEKQQERLHNGEVAASIPGSSSKQTNNDANKKIATTPQKDFLSKNLARINPMVKSSSFDNPRPIDNGQSDGVRNGDDADNEKRNPFTFDVLAKNETTPVRPPRQGPGTSKLAIENYSPPSSNPPRLNRQISESTAIRKIQATLQRTFSRKGSAEPDGIANEAFEEDQLDAEEKATPKRKLTPEKRLNVLLFKKAPLEKSLSMPDMQNRLKKRERLMA